MGNVGLETSIMYDEEIVNKLPGQVPRHRHFSQLERNVAAMSDNAAVESFFGLLKRERVNRVRYRTRDEARADLFDYIEVFYNRKRRHG